MDAVGLLSEIIAQGTKVRSQMYRARPGYSALVEAGFLREAGVSQSIICDACDVPHDAEIVFEDGRYGFVCPDLGFSPIERSAIVAVEPNLTHLVYALADAFDCKRRKSSAIRGRTWRIGLASTHAGDVAMYFHPVLRSADELRDLEDALKAEPRSSHCLVLTVSGTLAPTGAKATELSPAIEINPSGNLTRSCDLTDILGLPAKPTGGRPSPFAARLDAIMMARLDDEQSRDGLNAEAKEVIAIYLARFPDQKAPSLSTVKAHLTAFRTGQ